MYKLIERYLNKLSITDLKNFSLKQNIELSDQELNFTYSFIKKNWQTILANQGRFNIDKYKNQYSPENFDKIKKLVKEYTIKYQQYL